MTKTIYILGNPLVTEDSLPIKILPKLKQTFPSIKFVHLDPTEEILLQKDKKMFIIDTIEGITNVTLFNSLGNFEKSPRFSVHDYDLLLDLTMQKKLGKINEFVIVGVPQKGNSNQIEKELINCVSTLL